MGPRAHALLVVGLVLAYVGMGLIGTPPVVHLVISAAGATGILVLLVAARQVTLLDLGLRIDNLRAAVPSVAVATAAFAAGAVVWARVADRPLWSPDLVWMLPLYPHWGIAQQVFFQGILHRSLRAFLPALPAILVTAVTFALVHWGWIELVALTAGAGLVWSALYARWPNTIVLGISHGISGALAYPLLLGHNPITAG